VSNIALNGGGMPANGQPNRPNQHPHQRKVSHFCFSLMSDYSH